MGNVDTDNAREMMTVNIADVNRENAVFLAALGHFSFVWSKNSSTVTWICQLSNCRPIHVQQTNDRDCDEEIRPQFEDLAQPMGAMIKARIWRCGHRSGAVFASLRTGGHRRNREKTVSGMRLGRPPQPSWAVMLLGRRLATRLGLLLFEHGLQKTPGLLSRQSMQLT